MAPTPLATAPARATSPATVLRTATWPAMGSTAAVVLHGGPAGLLDLARARLEDLEARWSRFRPDTELARVAAAGGGWVRVSPATATLLGLLGDAHELTGGLIDPRVGAVLAAAGYDHPMSAWPDPGAPLRQLAGDGPPAAPIRGPLGLEVRGRRARMDPAAPLDPGCCGKGLAADLVAAELVAAGAAGCLVDVGGDVAVAGTPPDPAGWGIGVVGPDGGALALLALDAGGVATSSTRRRRWRRGDGTVAHHIIDPRTGRPAATDLAQITVVAGSAAWAEVLATAGLIAGTAALATGTAAAGALVGVPAIAVGDDGHRIDLGDVRRWCRP